MNLNRKIQIAIIFLAGALLTYAGVYFYRQAQLLQKMQVGFSGGKIKSLSLSSITLELGLKFSNVSDIDITIQTYAFDVYINGKAIMKIIAPPPFIITGGTDTTTMVDVTFEPKSTLANLFSGDVITALLFDYSKVIVQIKGPITLSSAGITVDKYQIDQSQTLADLIAMGS